MTWISVIAGRVSYTRGTDAWRQTGSRPGGPLGDAAFAALERARSLGARLAGARSFDVRTSVGTVHGLEVSGRGVLPTTVLLHGLSSSAVDYAPLLRRLRRRCRRVVAIDCPGHGRSPMPGASMRSSLVETGLFEALDHVAREPIVLFGNSMGGMLAARYASRRPARVRSLILASPAGAPSCPQTLTRLKQRFELRSLLEARSFVRDVFVRRRWYELAIAWAVRRRFAAPPIRALLAAVDEGDVLTPAELSRLTMPVLLLWGRQEALLPRAHYDFFAEHLPAHACALTPPGFGHAPHVDHPGALAEYIWRFGALGTRRPPTRRSPWADVSAAG